MARQVTVMAHELNNYLTVIQGYSELLLDQLGSREPARAHVQDIQQAAGQAIVLCQNLLDVSRASAPQVRTLDLNAVVSEVERRLRPILNERVRLVISLASGPTKFLGDQVELERAILNLAWNAHGAMPRGGELRIETRCEGSWAILIVKDNGCGMDEITRARIFEPFFTTKPRGQGTGLGLLAVRRAVDHCGGRIEVESELGRGSKFTLYFPRVEERV